jgi:LacI family transcriptional regulator
MSKQPRVRLPGKGRVTIGDVASSCGVSEATVSNVLSNKPYVSAATRELVLKAVKRLNYTQSPIAQALRTGKSNVIGLVVSNLGNPFYAEVLLGVSNVLTPAGYQAIICNTESDPRLQTRHINSLLQRSVDGIILLSQTSHTNDVATIQRAQVPLVTLWRYPEGNQVNFVGMDDDVGMRAALDHLWGLGHRSMALIRGMAGASTGDARERSFRSFLGKKGQKIAPGSIIECPTAIEASREATQRLLKLKRLPTAIIATGDLPALGATIALSEAGLSVPEDMSVIGFDDTFVAALPQVDLTCVASPRFDIGVKGAETLLRKIAAPGGPIERVLLKPGFRIRSTTASPRKD